MNLTSLHYLIFLGAAAALHFALPRRLRWVVLLAASYYFYASWKLEYVAVLAGATAVSYGGGLAIARARPGAQKRLALAAGIVLILGALVGFKYLDFFNDTARALFARLSLAYSFRGFGLLAPIGISFYALQATGYLVDVYRGKTPPERHLGVFAVFVSFFPQLVSGPIERAGRVLPQVRRASGFSFAGAAEGLALVVFGLFQKLVIADRLAIYVDEVFAHPAAYRGWPVAVAAYFYTIQIFCDFAGYTDIALGSARLLGYELVANFDRPYFSTTVVEFWRRWHISLSTWFRDYLFIPLGGSRVSAPRRALNLMIVFLVSGLWHGARWTFVAWGGLHGAYMVASVATGGVRERLARRLPGALRRARAVVQAAIVFHLVAFAWIFFRADSLATARTLIANLLRPAAGGRRVAEAVFSSYDLKVAIAAILFLAGVHVLQGRRGAAGFTARMSTWARWAYLYALVAAILVFGEFGITKFIYSQF